MCLSHLIYTVRPCLIHTCHAAPMPCSDHAVLLKATAQHSRRETACGLPARVRLLPATTRSSTKTVIKAYQSSSQRSIPTTVKSGSSTLQKRRSVKLLDLQFGYFRLTRGLERRTRHCRSRAGARHGMCELTHDMARERHGHGMLCVNPPLLHPYIANVNFLSLTITGTRKYSSNIFK